MIVRACRLCREGSHQSIRCRYEGHQVRDVLAKRPAPWRARPEIYALPRHVCQPPDKGLLPESRLTSPGSHIRRCTAKVRPGWTSSQNKDESDEMKKPDRLCLRSAGESSRTCAQHREKKSVGSDQNDSHTHHHVVESHAKERTQKPRTRTRGTAHTALRRNDAPRHLPWAFAANGPPPVHWTCAEPKSGDHKCCPQFETNAAAPRLCPATNLEQYTRSPLPSHVDPKNPILAAAAYWVTGTGVNDALDASSLTTLLTRAEKFHRSSTLHRPRSLHQQS